MIAFLGSGISLPYGAITWEALEQQLSKKALDVLKRAKEEGKKLNPQLLDRMDRLQETISQLKDVSASPEQNLTRLEFYRLAFEISKPALNDDKDFHKEFAKLFQDDRFIAEQLVYKRLNKFAEGLGHDPEFYNFENDPPIKNNDNSKLPGSFDYILEREELPRDPNKLPLPIRNELRSFNFEEFYSVGTLKEKIEESLDFNGSFSSFKEDYFEDLKEAIDEDAINAGKIASKGGLPPDRRSIFSLIFANIILFALKNDINTKGVFEKFITKRLCTDVSDGNYISYNFLSKELKLNFINTSKDLRPRSDPINDLVKKLDFWRFLTTNYDFEVERYFEHINYPRGTLSMREGSSNNSFKENVEIDSGRRHAQSFLGDDASSDVLTEKSIGELIDISTRSRDVGARIMHVHGRADRPETIISTETDYQNLYLRHKSSRQSFDHGLQIVFSGNPILFIGLGLQEQDLQKPLREFISNENYDDRELFALMPATKDRASCEALKIETYLRYGVRIIFYGEALHCDSNLPGEDIEKGEKDIKYNSQQIAPIDYGLYIILSGINLLKQYLNMILKSLEGYPETEEGIEKLRTAYIYVRNLGFLNFSNLNPAVVDDIKKNLESYIPTKHWGWIVFGNSENSFFKQFKMDRLSINEVIKNLNGFLASIEHAYPDIDQKYEILNKVGDKQIVRLKPALELCIDYLNHLPGKLISSTLINALEDLETLQSRWWRDVRFPPDTRCTSDGRVIDEGSKEITVNMRQPIVWPINNSTFLDTNVQSLIELMPSYASKPARLFFCFSDTGIGKGSFYYRLSHHLIRSPKTDPQYTHFWISNLSHSLEYSSVMVGIGNFLRQIACAAGISTDDKTILKRARIGHLAFIKDIVEEICKAPECMKRKHRGLLILAGFDRLIHGNDICRTIEIEQTCRQLARLVQDGKLIDVVIISGRRKDVSNIFLPPLLNNGTVKKENQDEYEEWINKTKHEFWIKNEETHLSDHGDIDRLNLESFKQGVGLLLNIKPSEALNSEKPSQDQFRKEIENLFGFIKLEIISTKLKKLKQRIWRAYKLLRSHNGLTQDYNHKAQYFQRSYLDLISTIGFSVYMRSLIDELLKQFDIWTFPIKMANNTEGIPTEEDIVKHLASIYDRKSQWMNALNYRLQSSSTDKKASRVIEAVLDQYGLQIRTENSEIDYKSRVDFLVLKNLAFFGFPTEGAVLFRSPEIKNYLVKNYDSILKEENPNFNSHNDLEHVDRAAIILQDSLKRLLSRRLIGAIEPRGRAVERGDIGQGSGDIKHSKGTLNEQLDYVFPKNLEPNDIKKRLNDLKKMENGFRYILHPQIKKFITSKFSVVIPDEGFTNTFVYSIFAAQPVDVALLSSGVQSTIDKLIDELTQAWRSFPILPLKDLTTGIVQENGTSMQAVSDNQLKEIKKIAQGQKLRVGIENENLNIPENYIYRGKTVNGLLARASADMPMCFRSVYGILRQLRPFSVLVRLDETLENPLTNDIHSPFDRTSLRLKQLLEGIISSQQAREVVTKIAEKDSDGTNTKETFDTKIVTPFINAKDENTKEQWRRLHPVNTFGPRSNPECALYPHELAWIWNERGVIAFAQGKMYDAIPFYNMALEALKDHEGHEGFAGPGKARILLNIATVNIERGNLRRAQEQLKLVIDDSMESSGPISNSNKDEYTIVRRHVVRPISIGYQGLILHLQGDLESAIKKYDEALNLLTMQSRLRAVSIFRKHRSDAYAALGNIHEAEQDILHAISSAQSMMQIDQLHFARLSEVRLSLLKKTVNDQKKATRIIESVIDYASSMNLYRLLCEALFYDARLKTNQGQYDLASKSAAQSVAIATKQGMKVRRISITILLGEIFCRKKDTATGLKLLDDAGEAAQRIGYQLAVERKQKAMFDLKLDTSNY